MFQPRFLSDYFPDLVRYRHIHHRRNRRARGFRPNRPWLAVSRPPLTIPSTVASAAVTSTIAIPVAVTVAFGPLRALAAGRKFPFRAFQSQHLGFDRAHHGVVFLSVFEEIRDIEERIAVQSNIDKGRLHSRQDAGNTSLMNAAGQ